MLDTFTPACPRPCHARAGRQLFGGCQLPGGGRSLLLGCTRNMATCTNGSPRLCCRSVACRSSESDSSRALPARIGAGPLLPELAQLPLLGELQISCLTLSQGSVPAEWGTRGAWPSLRM